MIQLKNCLSRTFLLTLTLVLTLPINAAQIIAAPRKEQDKEIWSYGYLYGFLTGICKLREEGFISEYHSNIAAKRAFSFHSKKLRFMSSRKLDDLLESAQNPKQIKRLCTKFKNFK